MFVASLGTPAFAKVSRCKILADLQVSLISGHMEQSIASFLFIVNIGSEFQMFNDYVSLLFNTKDSTEESLSFVDVHLTIHQVYNLIHHSYFRTSDSLHQMIISLCP